MNLCLLCLSRFLQDCHLPGNQSVPYDALFPGSDSTAILRWQSFFTWHKVAGEQKIIKETLENPLKYSFSISLSTGIKVIGGVKELTGEEFGVYVKRILPGGLASTDGKTWNPETFGQTVLEQHSLNLD